MKKTSKIAHTAHFTPRATLAAIGVKLRIHFNRPFHSIVSAGPTSIKNRALGNSILQSFNHFSGRIKFWHRN
jgi:hypothetical protein